MRRASFRGGRWQGWLIAPLLIASSTAATATASAASNHSPTPVGAARAVANGVVAPSWVRANDGVQRPPAPFPVTEAGYAGVMAYDARREQSVLFYPARQVLYRPSTSSQTWVFDGATRRWSRSPASTPPLYSGQIAYDAQEGVVVLIGSPLAAVNCETKPAQTWTWNGTTWTQLHPKTAPPECSVLQNSTSMAYDGATHRIITVTPDPSGDSGVQNTWVWDGNSWTHRSRGPLPLPQAAIAYDPVSQRVLAFGGYDYGLFDGVPGTRTIHYQNETSAWNGNRWVQLLAGGGPNDPPARGLAMMTFDPLVNAVVLFGGATGKETFRFLPAYLDDTWRWVGGHWVQMATETSPPTMAGASFVYDTAHHIGVLHGDETWLLSTVRAGGGYFLSTRGGAVVTFGDAHNFGGTTGTHLARPIVGIARTATHNGYWLAASDGGIFTFGDASFYGSTGGMRLNQPIVGIAATPTREGYYLVASDGGIFNFGDAPFDGSTGGMHLNQPIVAMAATPTGEGYWLVASDGGIFTFGDARFYGSASGIPLNQPIVAMASTPTGDGYWLVSRDGQVFAFGAARSFGAFAAPRPIVAIASSPTGHGYWLITNSGIVKAFGDAKPHGDTNGQVNAPIVAAATT